MSHEPREAQERETPITVIRRVSVALAAVLVSALVLCVAWRLIAFLAFIAFAFVAAVLLTWQLRAISRLSGAPIGWLTWCLMVGAGVAAFAVVSGHVWDFTERVVAAAAAADRHFTWEDDQEIRAYIDVPANGFAAFYVGPLAVLLIRDLVYRVRQGWHGLRKAGAANRRSSVQHRFDPPPSPLIPPDDRLRIKRHLSARLYQPAWPESREGD